MDSDKVKVALEQLAVAARAVAEAMGEAEWKRYEGDWNHADRPADPGCWRIKDGKVWIHWYDGEVAESAHSLADAIENIRKGVWARNQWPIPGEPGEFDGEWCPAGSDGPAFWRIKGRTVTFHEGNGRTELSIFGFDKLAEEIKSGEMVRWPIPTEPAAVELPEGYGVCRALGTGYFVKRYAQDHYCWMPTPHPTRPTFAEALADAHAHAKGGKP